MGEHAAKAVAWLCATMMVVAVASCNVFSTPRENDTVACVKAGGEWRLFACRPRYP